MPDKISDLEEKAIERTDHLLVAEGITGNKKVLAEFLPITEAITKTVASPDTVDPSTYDFADFDTAMKWVEGQTTNNIGNFTLLLADGVHLIQETEGTYDCYVFKDVKVILKSEGGVPADCTITFSPTIVGTDYRRFIAGYGAYIKLDDVTIDATLGGAEKGGKGCISSGYPSGYIFIWKSSIKNFNNTSFNLQSGKLYLYQSSIENSGSIYPTISVDDSYVEIKDGSMTDCTRAIQALGSVVSINDFVFENTEILYYRIQETIVDASSNVTYTNNTETSTFPFNEVQSDGSFISDGTASMFFKDAPNPILTEVTLTVASPDTVDPTTYDYPDFDSAMRWVEAQYTNGYGQIVLTLADGVHTMMPNPDESTNKCYILKDIKLTLESESSDASLCSLTFDASIADSTRTGIFGYNTYFSFYKITVDATLGGATGDNKYFTYTGFPSSIVSVSRSIFKNFLYSAIYVANGNLTMSYGDFDNCGGAYQGAVSVSNGFFNAYRGSFTDCTLAADYWNCTVCRITKTSFTGNTLCFDLVCTHAHLDDVTFSDNITIYEHPINERQASGSLLSDGSTPIVDAGHAGDTASRPAGVPIGFQYFDTDAGKVIYWNGIEWVDALGVPHIDENIEEF